MEMIVDDRGTWARPSAGLPTISPDVALPTAIVTSPCKNDRTVEGNSM